MGKFKRICLVCGKLFTPNKFAGKRQKYCSLKCRSRDYYHRYYEHFVWKQVRRCKFCGKEFIPKVFNQFYCSSYHRKQAWKKRNWDRVLKWTSEWMKKKRKEDPEKYRQRVRNRKALKKAGGGKVTLKEWEKLKRENNYKCAICGKREPEIKLTQDHIIPLSKKGKHLIKNIQPLCHSCNSRKKDRIYK